MTLTGAVGWLASLRLAIDDRRLLEDPDHVPSCGVSTVVGCGSAMASPQGNLLGFPNMLIAWAPSPRWPPSA